MRIFPSWPLGLAATIGGVMLWRRGNGFSEPIPGALVTSGWGDPRTYRDGIHQGLDFSAKIGTPVCAVADGTVTAAYPYADSNAGKFVAVAHKDGLTSEYMHLDKLAVAKGQRVGRGELVGYSGNTADPVFTATEPHLHLQMKLNGKPVPSENYIPVKHYKPTARARAASRGVTLASTKLATISGVGLVGLGVVQVAMLIAGKPVGLVYPSV